MTYKNQHLQYMEQLKVDEKRARDRQMFMDVWTDNEGVLKVKAKKEKDIRQYDKAVIAESLKRDIMEEKKRKMDLDRFMGKASGGEGAVFKLNTEIIAAKKLRDDTASRAWMDCPNSNEKQMKISEEVSRYRTKNVSKSLNDAWGIQISRRAEMNKQRDLDDSNLNKGVLDLAKRELLRDQEKKRLKKEAVIKYRQELDHQYQDIQQRSRDTIMSSMNMRERSMNTSLLK
eukprot:CAMPEP_0119054834 /NCGR_PEP_ID=MMETSP1177-20130426/75346_1 /TAXON_ID=2985 /ORGANISM="Ochromonas sp, Strain CCMP1899" /LENGTH=229 /DNA_ID=CAMNT_0007035223 /DNA_START=644 /DNA_END=1333 /DNA_ORIENTATION=-